MPFARYVLEHSGKLEFPFRRYQIQPAWRGERPQDGRYRQFTQADIDVVGRDELPFHHDVEVVRVMVEALDALPLPNLSFQVNNRKLIQGFYRGLGIPDVTAAIRQIDKLDKQPADAVAALLVSEAGATDEQAQRCLDLAQIRVADTSFVERVRALGVEDELLDEGLTELAAVIDGCASAVNDHVSVEANLRIARGLDYYTGTVLEVFMAGYERLKSVAGGGRYDALASDGRTTYPGVGISFGVSRTLIPLFADGALEPGPKVPSTVLVALVDEESRPASEDVATRAAQPRHRRPRWPRARRSSASRSGTPSAAASPTSGSRTSSTRSRTSAAAISSRRPDLDTTRGDSQWCASRVAARFAPCHAPGGVPSLARRRVWLRSGALPCTRPEHAKYASTQEAHHRDPHPRRRLAACRARGPDRDARRLGGPPPRPRRRHVHRPARGQRGGPGRHAR